jgi:CBS domain-containing protein
MRQEEPMIAKDIMTRSVRMIGPGDDVRAAARIMTESGVSALPVVDDAQRVVGIVSEGDLLRRGELRTTKRHSWWLEFLASPETLATEYIKAHAVRIRDVMTRPVISVTEQTPIPEIVSILEEHRIKRVPVLMGGSVVGIVSRGDLVKALARQEQPSRADTEDRAIRNTLLQRLKGQAWAPASGISLSVLKGVVTLHGLLSSDEQRRALTVMAETIPGVTEVKNETVVLPFIPMAS